MVLPNSAHCTFCFHAQQSQCIRSGNIHRICKCDPILCRQLQRYHYSKRKTKVYLFRSATLSASFTHTINLFFTARILIIVDGNSFDWTYVSIYRQWHQAERIFFVVANCYQWNQQQQTIFKNHREGGRRDHTCLAIGRPIPGQIKTNRPREFE